MNFKRLDIYTHFVRVVPSSLKKKMTRVQTIMFFLAVSLAFVTGCFFNNPISITTPVQAESGRLQLQDYTDVHGYHRLLIYCDTANGDLIYHTGSQGGIFVSRDRCQKDPRFSR